MRGMYAIHHTKQVQACCYHRKDTRQRQPRGYQARVPRSKNSHSHARSITARGWDTGGWYAPVRRTNKGGATFERTSDPLHTTPRSLFHARGAGVLWGYFACKNAHKKVLGVKWCQATTARLRLLLDDKMSTFAQSSDYRYLVVVFSWRTGTL